MARDKTYALSFGKNVADYERGRPGYPDEAVDWMLGETIAAATAPGDPPPSTRLDVVDVGAGTGKFTASLARRELNVTAVEPDDVMRDSLIRSLPNVTALAGTAEALPVDDGSAHLITFAQSWHWVDVPLASAEAHRVLRSNGTLALVWNIRDESVDWVARLSEIIGTAAGEQYDSVHPTVAAPFHRVAHATFAWDNELTRDQLFAMVTSRSTVILLEPDARRQIVDRVAALLDEHPELSGKTTYFMPYETRVTLYRRPV